MKHAYLIIAHSSKILLKNLIESIDDPRNDIYIHLAKKAKFDISDISTTFSRLYLIPNRIDARWGDYSLVEVELNLMKEASDRNKYQYYHFLSGVDFPIASQNDIHLFFNSHAGKEFIGFANHASSSELKWRSQHYFLFSKHFQSRNVFLRTIRKIFAEVQSICGYKRYPYEIKKGCQWCSITDDFVKFLLSNRSKIKKYFSHTYCPDELVIQTFCWNSHFKERVFDLNDEFRGCQRYINWDNSEIHLMDNESPQKMVSSEYLFARKFSEEGLETLHKIYEMCISPKR